jgi:hypothetical protein
MFALVRLLFALLALTPVVVRTQRVPGSETLTETDITFDNSYEAEGEPVTAAELGLRRVNAGWCNLKNGSEAEATPVSSAWFDPVAMKLHLNNAKTSKELAGAADASKVVVRVFALGK